MEPNQTYRLLYSKVNHIENEKATPRMGQIFSNNAVSKGLISKIHKHLIQLNKKQTKSTQPKNEQKT